jgi:hypothetical protein
MLFAGSRSIAFKSYIIRSKPYLYVAKLGRKPVIRLQDSFVLFLHWLRSVSLIGSIASAFHLRLPTLYTHLDKTGKAIHKVFVDRYIKSQLESPLRAPVKYPECGIIVDAMMQKRGWPAGAFEEAKWFFSGKQCKRSGRDWKDRDLAWNLVIAPERTCKSDTIWFTVDIYEYLRNEVKKDHSYGTQPHPTRLVNVKR